MGKEDRRVPTTSDVPTTQRRAREASGSWLDRLFVAACDTHAAASLDEACGWLLDAVKDEIDGGLGVCISTPGQGQTVVRRSARDDAGHAPDPTRLFPEFRHERVVPLPLDDGSTLHAASDDEALIIEGGPLDLFFDRVARALAAHIVRAREHAGIRHQAHEMQGLQAQVIQSEKLASLGQIAAGIVHELNNPLTSIVAYSDYLRKKAEKGGGDPADVERLSRINEAAERILRFSRDLIAYSRPSLEVPAPVPIHEIIDRALVFCEHVLDQTGVLVERNFGTTVRPVRGVAGQLTQVFVNLFTNAAHAMNEGGGCLSVTTEMTSDDAISITIIDDGHGIDTDHLPRIFDPFFTTKSDGSGTGLGLSIVRNIVTAHGGAIRAVSNTPRGTVFQVDLPAAAAPKNDP